MCKTPLFILVPKQEYTHLHHLDVLRMQGRPDTFTARWAYCTCADHLHSICTAGLTIFGFVRHSVCMLYSSPPQCAVDLS